MMTWTFAGAAIFVSGRQQHLKEHIPLDAATEEKLEEALADQRALLDFIRHK